jgi:predicted SnoaL-like aldol condensation-catalyzing enzyme
MTEMARYVFCCDVFLQNINTMDIATTNLKDAAKDFLRMVTAGKIREAFKLYTGKEFRHHNIEFKGDAQSLMTAMEENQAQFPNKKLDIKHVLQDGDLVAIHSHVIKVPKDPGAALVHIFRFKNDKVVEFWDMGQPIPEKTVNENGMF